jgi:glycosyltransferase involved in cell wall biosynthesis
MVNNTTIGIVIPTYQRVDGKTPELLSRALKSIKNQTHTDYKVFLIGDKYENDNEFVELATSIIDTDKIYYENLSTAVEREKYPIGSHQLWCAGGVSATNWGIEKSMSQCINYICHLDHDDYWETNHLEVINKVLDEKDTAFVYTCSTYVNNGILPIVNIDGGVEVSIPSPEKLIHSSVCIDFDKIPLRYRDVFSETLQSHPADADMWDRVGNYIKENKLNSVLIKKLTCFHPTERK